jgi:HSP20 family protein
MKINVASESDFGNIARHLGKLDPFHKGYYGFVPSDTWTPNVNLYESETCYLVCVDLAGVEKKQIEVTVHNARLKLTGRRETPDNQNTVAQDAPPRLKVHLMEIDHGNFSREVELPADVNQSRIAASFNNGLLWIELPKT